MAISDTLLNIGAEAMAAAAAYAAIQDGDTDADETSTSRVEITWGSASGGDIEATNLQFTGDPEAGATHVGLWSAATDGTFYGATALTGDQAFNAAGEYTVDSLKLSGATGSA